MDIPIDIPEDIAHRLQQRWEDLSRRALESIAVQAYREGVLTASEVQQMLGLSSRWEVEAFLRKHDAYLDYTEAELARDVRAIRRKRDE